MGECLAYQDTGRRGLLVHHPAQLLGDAKGVNAELVDLGQQLGGRRTLGVSLLGGGPDFRLGEVAHRLLEHLLLVVGADVEKRAGLARRLTCGPGQLLCGLEGAPGGGRRAEAILGALEERPLDLFARPDPIEQIRAGEPVERPQTDAHAALGDSLVVAVHLDFLPLLWLGLVLASSGVTWPSRWGICRFASRTEKSICSPLVSLRNSTLPGRRIGLRKRTSTLKASGRRPSSAARQRALVHIPWAIALGKPSGFALSACMWIGLRSPDTAAYRRPKSPAKRHVALGVSSSSRRWAENASMDDVFGPSAGCWGLARRSIVLVDSQASSSSAHASVSRLKVWPRLCGSSGVGRTTSFSSSPRPIGRCWTIPFSTWTRPTAPKGKLPSAITAMCKGKASTCG